MTQSIEQLEGAFDSAQFGAAIRRRRRALGITQEEVSLAAGVSRRVIGELEGGRGTVRLEIALRVARAVGVDVVIRSRGPGRPRADR